MVNKHKYKVGDNVFIYKSVDDTGIDYVGLTGKIIRLLFDNSELWDYEVRFHKKHKPGVISQDNFEEQELVKYTTLKALKVLYGTNKS